MRRLLIAVVAALGACAYQGPTTPTPLPSGGNSGGSSAPSSTPPASTSDAELRVALTVGPNPPTEDQRTAFSATLIAGPTLVAPVTYAWNFGDGTTAQTSDSPTFHSYDHAGKYTASVAVTDAAHHTAHDDQSVTVLSTPAPPPPPAPPAPSYSVALAAAPSSLVVGTGSTLTATATAQNGAPAAPTIYEWDCDGDGTFETNTGALNTTTCAYGTVGTTKSAVRASNGTAAGTGTASVTVLAAAPLYVKVTTTAAVVQVNVAEPFTASLSTSGGMPAAVEWQWDFEGDAAPDLTANNGSSDPETYTYRSTGKRTLTVTAIDHATGRQAVGTLVVDVQP